METNSCLAIPSNEDGELTVYASTQNPTEGQKLIAHALNISMNKVVVKVKRLGGGFGGKETRCTPLIVAAAFAASKVNLPVKFSLDRDQVMFKCITTNEFMGSNHQTMNSEFTKIFVKPYHNGGNDSYIRQLQL